MSILDTILAQKEKEIVSLKEKPIHNAERPAPSADSISQAFYDTKRINVISEIKRASPSKGSINSDVDPVQQAKTYAACGAGAISVLTDETFFKGSMDDLRAVREAVSIPILCKDFIIDEVQIDHAKAAGADIILLIAAARPSERLKTLYNYASDLGLEVLFEVHNETEMQTAINLNAAVIGINNRDLNTFEVDLNVTRQLASMVQNPETIMISESGFKTGADVQEITDTGIAGILIGETLMRSNDLTALFSELQVSRSKQGITDVR